MVKAASGGWHFKVQHDQDLHPSGLWLPAIRSETNAYGRSCDEECAKTASHNNMKKPYSSKLGDSRKGLPSSPGRSRERC
jgi:hypothetical protein